MGKLLWEKSTMTDLFEKSIQTLELPQVLERLADQAVTEEGKQRCRQLRPMIDFDDIAPGRSRRPAQR